MTTRANWVQLLEMAHDLDEKDEFWTGESMPKAQRKVGWLNQNISIDKARD